MKHFVLFLAASVLVLASGAGGLKPRPSPADYPANEAGKDVTIAAAVLTPQQVKSLFATELKEFVVIEVAVYPVAGKSVDLSIADFAMRAGSQGELVRAANPEAIAAANQRKHDPRPSRANDVAIYPSATIGYESGTYTDPVTGQRRRNSGVYTDTGVGVGVGGNQGPQAPRPGGSNRDRDVMNQELTDKTLPGGATSDPVAGYLYFRLPSKARTSALELQYFAADGKIRVPLPAVKTK